MFKSSVLVGVLLVIILAADAVPLMCARYCGNVDFDPICGYNGKELKLFNNECELKNSECGEQITWEHQPLEGCLSPLQNLIVVGVLDPIFSIDPIERKPAVESVDAIIDPIERITIKLPLDPLVPVNCDFACIDVYDPVCGFDGTSYVVFSNGCQMSGANCLRKGSWTRVESNLCNIEPAFFSERVELKPICASMCPDYFRPTCGFDGTTYKTFSNACYMESFNCNNAVDYEPASDEKCNINTGVLY